MRPIRSLLFVPGNRPDRFGKALASGADAIVLDLEDSVPPPELAHARKCVGEFLDERDPSAERAVVLVRTGDPRSAQIEEDMAAVVRPGLFGLVLPLVQEASDVTRADEMLTRYETDAMLPQQSICLVPLLETPQGIRNTYEIARASKRSEYMGGATTKEGDVAHGLGYRWTAEGMETLYIRSKALLDVRAAGLRNPVTGLWTDIHDLDGLRTFSEQSRQLGYLGMIAIHPRHVAIINDVFSPSASEIAHWNDVLRKVDDMASRGLGAGVLEGELIATTNVKAAREGLERARAFGLC